MFEILKIQTCKSGIKHLEIRLGQNKCPCARSQLGDTVISWMFEDFSDVIDQRQFGCLKGSSTMYCLLNLFHNWLKNLENSGAI